MYALIPLDHYNQYFLNIQSSYNFSDIANLFHSEPYSFTVHVFMQKYLI